VDDASGGEGRVGVVVVAYILPLLIELRDGEWTIEWNQDAVLASKASWAGFGAGGVEGAVRWIGCPGCAVPLSERASLSEALEAFNCSAVFLDAGVQHDFYTGFCRSFLWPIFHNVIRAGCFSQSTWRAYCCVNRLFADKVLEMYDQQDLVWVHDYHLLLLPSYILRKVRNARVGLFVHTPFPSSEIFRTVSVRDELLRGMLNADVVGFHIFEYARHFLTCCKRMLGLEYDMDAEGDTSGFRLHDRFHTVIVQVSIA
jgi:trehalose 6-phosphate synthase/phosphatase